MHEGLRLQYLPIEFQQLRSVLEAKDDHIDALDDLIEHLKNRIQNAPCLVAHPGETTYECRHDDPCRVCRWRREVSEELVNEWHLPGGIW
jgi:hypothetical protein